MPNIEVEVWVSGVAYAAELELTSYTATVTSGESVWDGRWSDQAGFVSTAGGYMNLQVAAAVTDALKESEAYKSWLEAEPRVRALACHADCDLDDIDAIDKHDHTYFDASGRSYYVMTDDEADECARERVEASLWAFNPSFLATYVPALRGDRVQKAWGKMTTALCEEAGALVEALLGDRLDELTRDAVDTDGRGHFIASYDGHEHDAKDPVTGNIFYIYRD